MAYVSTVGYTETSITVDISGLSARQNTYNGFRFRINGGSWNYVSVQSGYTGYDSPNYTFYGLTCGNSYYIEAEAQTNSWYPADAKRASTDSCPLPPKDTTPPSIWNVQGYPDTNSIYVTWDASDADSGLSHFEVYANYAYNTVYGAYTRSHTLTQLAENTSYTIWVRAYDNEGNYADSSSKIITTLKGRPTNFSWDTSKISGQPFNVTASEWNRLQLKINEFRDFKNFNQFSRFNYYSGDYSFTIASYNAEFMAYHFNQARNAIGGIVSAPSLVSSGQAITASQFNSLVSSLNSIY